MLIWICWPGDPALSKMENSSNIILFRTDPARYVLRLVAI